MAEYTPEEIQGAVEKIVQAAVRRPYGALGNRQIGTTFGDYQQAAMGILILNANAPFYVVSLGCERLKEGVQDLRAHLVVLVDLIEGTNRRVKPITDISSLSNAAVALGQLEGAVGSRENAFESTEDVPAFKRFEQNTQRFLDSASSQIRSDGSIVPTPEESRNSIAGAISEVIDAHGEVLRKAGTLRNSIDDFSSLKLPQVLAQSVISNTRNLIRERTEILSGLDAKERLGVMRDTTLEILAARAVVRNFTSLKSPGTFASVIGTGELYADADHPATPARLVATTGGVHPIILNGRKNNTELDVTIDGSFSFVAALPGSFVARVDGTVNGPFVFVASDNDEIRISYEEKLGFLTPFFIDIGFPAGSQNIVVVVRELNALLAIGSFERLTAEPFISPTQFVGTVTIDATGSPSDVDLLSVAGLDWTTLNITENMWVRVRELEKWQGNVAITNVNPTTASFVFTSAPQAIVGNFIIIYDGFSANDTAVYQITSGAGTAFTGSLVSGPAPTTEAAAYAVVSTSKNQRAIYRIDVGGITSTTLTCTSILGPAPVDEPTQKIIEIGSFVLLRIRVTDQMAETSVQNIGSIGVVGDTDRHTATATLFGIFAGTSSTSRAVEPPSVALGINTNTTSALGDAPRMTASYAWDSEEGVVGATDSTTIAPSVPYGRSEPFSPAQITLYYLRARTNVTVGGALATFVVTDLLEQVLPLPAVVVNQQIRIKTSPVLADQGIQGTITATTINADGEVTGFTALMDSAISISANVLVELYETTTPITYPAGSVIRVYDGLNAGDYVVGDIEVVNGFDILVRKPLPSHQGTASQPVTFRADIDIYKLVLESSSVLVDTKVEVTDGGSNPESGASLFFSSLPAVAYGTTAFLRLASIPKDLEVGDTLELYTTNYAAPAYFSTVVGIEEALNIIELGTPLSTNASLFSFDFATDIPPPFARIRKQKKNQYSLFKDAADSFLNDAANKDNYFSELYRLVNSLINTTNPTMADMNAAKAHVQVLDTALAAFETDLDIPITTPVAEVDALIRAYQEKGAQRATDILLEGRFSDFFGLSQDGVSYAGAVLSMIKDVSREDLPVRKTDRASFAERQAIKAQFEEPDFEFDQSDLDPFGEVDIPGDFMVPFKGEAF